MKNLIVIIFSLILIWGCEEQEFKVGPEMPGVDIIDMNIPEDATLRASVEFKIIGGTPPYFMFENDWAPGVMDTIDAASYHFKISEIPPAVNPKIIKIVDSEWGGTFLEVNFPVPDVVAIGKFKDSGESIIDIEYEVKNFGSEAFPFYMMNENVQSNVYSDGNDTPVPGNVITMGDHLNDDGFKGLEYTVYSFGQAFNVDPATFDYMQEGLYEWNVQGICPKYFHITTNDDWVKLHTLLGFGMATLPSPTKTGGLNYGGMPENYVGSEFNAVYSPDNFPGARGGGGVGWWCASVSDTQRQFIYLIRYAQGKTTFNAWGPPGGGMTGSRGWSPEHVRCVFDFN